MLADAISDHMTLKQRFHVFLRLFYAVSNKKHIFSDFSSMVFISTNNFFSFLFSDIFPASERTLKMIQRQLGTNMTSMKIVQFSRPTTPCPSKSEILPPSWPWTSNFERTPPPPLQMITNQLKENMIQGWILYVINEVTTELIIIFSDYYWHFLKWGIGQDICNSYTMVIIGITLSFSISWHVISSMSSSRMDWATRISWLGSLCFVTHSNPHLWCLVIAQI